MLRPIVTTHWDQLQLMQIGNTCIIHVLVMLHFKQLRDVHMNLHIAIVLHHLHTILQIRILQYLHKPLAEVWRKMMTTAD